MLPEEEIVRVCALVVSTATGVDPLAFKGVPQGKDILQYTRALWIYLVVAECGVDRGRASYLCERSFESIARNLAEVEEWRSCAEFDERLTRWASQTKALIGLVFDVTLLAPPAPSRRARLTARALIERAA